MKHQLSFAKVTLLRTSIAEVVVNKDVEISLEMVEELDAFLAEHFTSAFGLLINRVHDYHLSFEAKLSIASHSHLKAIAVVHYTKKSELLTKEFTDLRAIDDLNLQSFSALSLGWQQALEWLIKELPASSK